MREKQVRIRRTRGDEKTCLGEGSSGASVEGVVGVSLGEVCPHVGVGRHSGGQREV